MAGSISQPARSADDDIRAHEEWCKPPHNICFCGTIGWENVQVVMKPPDMDEREFIDGLLREMKAERAKKMAP
jgi:hypothetical protein